MPTIVSWPSQKDFLPMPKFNIGDTVYVPRERLQTTIQTPYSLIRGQVTALPKDRTVTVDCLTDNYKAAVESVVGRLGVKARAAGIFLIFAAQRPDAGVMPMQLRANLGNRLVLRVDGEGTSEIALGVKGAERLLGKGHLCAKLEGEADLLFAQVPFVGQETLDKLISSISANEVA
jgi:hypothetical protein